jgi:hypothetical protein
MGNEDGHAPGARGGSVKRVDSPAPRDVVFLLDNDQVERDLRAHPTEAFGAERQARYWELFEQLRAELGYADYLGALQRYRVENLRDPHLLEISLYLVDCPFAERLYPRAIEVVEHLRAWGPTVILSDRDVVFRPRKIERSGLWEAVEGRVLIYIHKEQMLDDVAARFPARHYVMVDDKVRILAAMKRVWGDQLTIVFPRQGHYALDPEILAANPSVDVTLERIGDLLSLDLSTLLKAEAT